MTLHIDDPEVDRLARELVEQTGEPIEQAIVKALRTQLEKEKQLASALAEIKEIQRRVAALPILDPSTPDEILGYDENGLPT